MTPMPIMSPSFPAFPGTFHSQVDMNDPFTLIAVTILYIAVLLLTIAVTKDIIGFMREEREIKSFRKKIEGDRHGNSNE